MDALRHGCGNEKCECFRKNANKIKHSNCPDVMAYAMATVDGEDCYVYILNPDQTEDQLSDSFYDKDGKLTEITASLKKLERKMKNLDGRLKKLEPLPVCPAVTGFGGCAQYATKSVSGRGDAQFPAILDQKGCQKKCIDNAQCNAYVIHQSYGCALYKSLAGCTGQSGWVGYEMLCPSYTCTTGTTATSCLTCVTSQTMNDQCATCNSGSQISGNVCVQIPPNIESRLEHALKRTKSKIELRLSQLHRLKRIESKIGHRLKGRESKIGHRLKRRESKIGHRLKRRESKMGNHLKHRESKMGHHVAHLWDIHS